MGWDRLGLRSGLSVECLGLDAEDWVIPNNA
jgi:hypothetical protein